ncbi:MAG: phosphoribosylformylglycinamidine synthase [Methylotenera sp.]|nr:phosphoribosylformylglycinamidine synthase [Oligoflexia bacterium]
MYARIEIATKPEFTDPAAHGLLRRIELAHPEIRKQIRWARWVDVYWLDVPMSREEMIPVITEIFWDRVLQWLFSGNLIPSAAGKHGGVLDLLETAPQRPGKFWALERRYRPGVTDNVSKTALEAFEIVTGKKMPEAEAASGSILLLEGSALTEESLSTIARSVLCNELIETWTLLSEKEITSSERFYPERIKRDFPRLSSRSTLATPKVDQYNLENLTDAELEKLSQKKLWALSLEEMKAIREKYKNPTDVEIEVLAQTWSEHCKHKIFGATVSYTDSSQSPTGSDQEIPNVIDGLFKETISGTTKQLPKPWLLSVFHDNAGIVAFDEDDAFCIKVETHNSPSALDPYGGALTGIVGVNRDILGCGLGARPVFNTNVFCVADPAYSGSLPDRLLHPRRILDGVRRGVEHGGNKSGVPTINGALVFDDRYLGKPLVYCGTGGFMPRVSAGRKCETKEVQAGDHILMVGGRIGKDGIHGATFSSLAMTESSPMSAVQLGDPITQKRAADFILEAREMGLYRAITDNGAGGLSSSVGEMAGLSGGARMDVGKARTKYPGLKPFELVVSESQERMTLAVQPEKVEIFMALAERRGVEVSDLGTFTDSGRFEIFYNDLMVADLSLEFLHKGAPRLHLNAEWKGRAPIQNPAAMRFDAIAPDMLLALLTHPNIASKEWMIRQYDHEVQGTSVIKPLHTTSPGTSSAMSGPNDGGVIKPKVNSTSGIAVACGINSKMSDVDPYLMAQSAVDEAVRNALCVGADFGREDSVFALVDNFCWPDPMQDPAKGAALVRACYGMKNAAMALGAPFVSGKDSMKNDFRGRLKGADVTISVPPTLLVTAVAKVSDIVNARSADFKYQGDVIYLLGGSEFGLQGSQLAQMKPIPADSKVGEPDWGLARKVYSWIGGATGKEQSKLHSLHDVSEGGMLASVAESLIARGFGAVIEIPAAQVNEASRDTSLMEFSFGEGFHSFVASVSDSDSASIEAEWTALGVPFIRLGKVTGTGNLEVKWTEGTAPKHWFMDVKRLRAAWRKEGYWE